MLNLYTAGDTLRLTVQKEGNCHGSLMPTVSSERRVKLPLPGNPVEVVRCAACLALMVLSIWRSVNLAGTCRGLWTLNTKCKEGEEGEQSMPLKRVEPTVCIASH